MKGNGAFRMLVKKGSATTCSAFLAILFFAFASGVLAQNLILTNPLNVDRSEEVIEIPLKHVIEHLRLAPNAAKSIVAEDSATGVRIASQLDSSKPDATPDRLLLLVHLPARGQERIRFRSDPNAAQQRAQVFGRAAPERLDDFAWENEEVAYRIYGPALQATGEISSGIDVWSKRVPNLVIDTFYRRAVEAERTNNPDLSYHIDNGQGLDSYDVGPTRGCGGTAVFADGRFIVSKNYTSVRILDNGPIRFSFELSYASWKANGIEVSETKRITLDAGTHLNRVESTYTFQAAATLELAAAIAVHEGASAEFPVAGSIASVWDTPQNPSAGKIATGLVALPTEHARTLVAAGHAAMVFTRHSGEPFIYFAGSGWSKADMPTKQDWNNYLKLQLNMLQHPIEIRWSQR
jgi:hypothetical protein